MTRLVLVGAGHAHAQVLLDRVQNPLPGHELLVVSPTALAPYSGMVPGWLAGVYAFDDICIDFAALCAAAGARLVPAELDAIDADARRITLSTGEVLGYDGLSINVGSTLVPPQDLGAPVLSLRPLGRLRAAWESWQASYAAQDDDRPFLLTAVGAGAAGFESLLAVRARLQALRPQRPVHTALVSRGPALLPGLAPGAVRAAHRRLAEVGTTLRLGTACTPAVAAGSGLLLWATGAQAHAWQRDPARRGSLAVSDAGFIRVNAQLQSVSHPQVWAVGDCAGWETPLPKAGVYAVRMGPVLIAQLRAAQAGRTAAATYVPQPHFLALLATGDGRAIASRGRWSAEGRWLWRWKDHIDRGFLRRFQQRG